MYKTTRQTETFAASPHRIYQMLMNSDEHAKFTGAPASMNEDIGGAVSAYGGGALGINLELVPGQRIIQMWRPPEWPEHHYSTITYDLAAEGDGCRLTFTQSGVPEAAVEGIATGWTSFYWEKMREHL